MFTKSGYLMIVGAILAFIFNNNKYLNLYYMAVEQTPIAIQIGTFKFEKIFLVWLNEGLMVIFFFLIGLEIKHAVDEGDLSDLKSSMFPVIAAVGGMLIPAASFIFINLYNPVYLKGWAIPMATDIAFSLAILAMVSSPLPKELRLFLTTLAIIDDIGAILVIGLFYTKHISVFWIFCSLIVVGILVLHRYKKINKISRYIFWGTVLWYCTLYSGFHATLTGVLLALILPNSTKDNKMTILKMEKNLSYWVYYYILPIFAFFNSGFKVVEIHQGDLFNTCTVGIVLGLLVGKPLGVVIFTWIGNYLSLLNIPKNITWKMLWGVGFLTGIGFTMSLFIATLSFYSNHIILVYAKIGILFGSIFSAIIGFYLLSTIRGEYYGKQVKHQSVRTKV